MLKAEVGSGCPEAPPQLWSDLPPVNQILGYGVSRLLPALDETVAVAGVSWLVSQGWG